jgi:hypothetical protein
MTTLTCAISGLNIEIPHFSDLYISQNKGYFHPIFAASHHQLLKLYNLHCRNMLTAKESYLLFLAFLNYTEQVEWKHPVVRNPNDTATIALVNNNFAQLLGVIAQTDSIKHPSFKQPSYIIHSDNAHLVQIPNWIQAWKDNISKFYSSYASARERDDLTKLENKLSKLILIGEKPENYSAIVADWAHQTAVFPYSKAEKYKKIIRTCFNSHKMFYTALADIREVKDYCETNIDADSIHFHALMSALKQGIHNHINYLGGSPLSLGYTILSSERVTDKELTNSKDTSATLINNLITNAPTKEPIESDYPDKLAFIKAKLALRVAHSSSTINTTINTANLHKQIIAISKDDL